MKVLIIGLGSIAKKHIAALKKHQEPIEIYALRSSLTAPEYEGVVNVYEFEKLLNHQFDFIIISSPTAQHLSDIKRCLALDTPLFIEKPLSNTSDIGNVCELARQVPTYIGYNLRFLDCLKYVKDHYIENKNIKINEVNAYYGSYLPDWRPNTNYKKSYSANQDLGGGVHLDLSHEIDYLLWILGKPIKTNKVLKNNSSLNINAVDYANFILEYQNFIATVQLNYYRRDAKRHLEIIFDAYTISVDLLRNEVYKNGEVVFKSDQTIIDTYTEQMKYFIQNRSKKMFNNIDEALVTLEICL